MAGGATVLRNRAEYASTYYQANREREQLRNRRFRLRRWGLTDAEFTSLLDKQGGRCAVCRSDTPGGRWNQWHVDHDHAREQIGLIEVRGLLCTRCNVLLGYADDDPNRLIAAADYLRKDR